MAEMTIRLIPDPVTGKKNIIISLTGDQDALPHEHEQMHRALVNKILGASKLEAEEIGHIEITREENEKVPATPNSSGEQGQREAVAQGR
jgi:FtsH ternary system domain X3-analog